jgi:hypothetical protein
MIREKQSTRKCNHDKGGGQFEIKVPPKEVQSPLWMPFVRWISIRWNLRYSFKWKRI